MERDRAPVSIAAPVSPHTHQSLDRFRIQKDLSLVCSSMAGNAEVGWAALPDDLIQKVVDNYLSTEDLDYYVFFQRVCGGWLRARQSRISCLTIG